MLRSLAFAFCNLKLCHESNSCSLYNNSNHRQAPLTSVTGGVKVLRKREFLNHTFYESLAFIRTCCFFKFTRISWFAHIDSRVSNVSRFRPRVLRNDWSFFWFSRNARVSKPSLTSESLRIVCTMQQRQAKSLLDATTS